MTSLLLASVLLAAEAQPAAVAEAIVSSWTRARRPAPAGDVRLSRAAASVASRALETSAAHASEGGSVDQAVSEAGAADPEPRAVVVVAASPSSALKGVLERTAPDERAATHYGFASRSSGNRHAAVLLFAERRAVVDDVPRQVAVGAKVRLTGRLLPPLVQPSFFVTRPDGRAERYDSEALSSERFALAYSLPAAGRYAFEVMAESQQGPIVAALLQIVAVGNVDRTPPPPSGAFARPPLPNDAAGVVEAINLRRTAMGLAALTPDADLARVAQAHGDDMAKRAFFGHLTPEGKSVRHRLQAAGYAFRIAAENIGEAPSPLQAHDGIERSPAHLASVLDPEVSRVGVGIAKVRRSSGDGVLVVEVFARPTRAGAKDDPADVLAALNAERARRGLERLARDRTLDGLAQERVEALVRAGDPEAPIPGDSVGRRALRAIRTAESVALDVFVADSAPDALASKNLGQGIFTRVGIGTARGGSKRFGADRLWMVVIYAAVP